MLCSKIFSSAVNILQNSWRPQIEARRFRYWKEMREKGYTRRYGWEDTFSPRGLLPRSKEFDKVGAMKVYCPRDNFSYKRVHMGQNDYIDILGDGNLHPARIVKGVPSWLKTFNGNEFQRLLRKEKMFNRGIFPLIKPTKWSKMKSRMDFLWYDLNYRRRFH